MHKVNLSSFERCDIIEEMAKWFQHEIGLPAVQRGCHLITDKVMQLRCPRQMLICVTVQIVKVISGDLVQIKTGLCHIFSERSS